MNVIALVCSAEGFNGGHVFNQVIQGEDWTIYKTVPVACSFQDGL